MTLTFLRKRLRAFSKVGAFVLIFVVAAKAGILALSSDLAEEIESRTWDWRLSTLPHSAPQLPIRIIMIDQPSLDYIAREEQIYWPWPRGIYEAPLRYLAKAGAKAAAFDILFTEPSSFGVDDDNSFAAAMSETVPTVVAVALREGPTDESPNDIALFRERLSAANLQLPLHTYVAGTSLSGVTLPVPAFISASAKLANVIGEPDSDGVFRHTRPGRLFENYPVLNLPFGLVTLAYPERAFNLAPFLDEEGRLAVRFLGPVRTIPTYSFANVLISWQNILAGTDPLIPFDEFKDAIVLIGMDAPGLLDLRPTPLSSTFSGVEFNATVAANLLTESFVKKFSFTTNMVIAALSAAFASVVLGIVSSVGIQVAALLAGFLALWGGSFLLASQGYWLFLVAPTFSFGTAVLLGLLYQYMVEGRQHRFIRNAFRFYVSPDVVNQIVSDPSQLTLGGARRELTIFFSDIVGFTSISETLEATDLGALLNRYLTSFTDVILESGGTVDKYVGDAVVAFWNAPLETEDHALRGVIAALGCQDRLRTLEPELQARFGTSVKARIGINTGIVSVGNFGSKARFNYTVIGDSANLASRLEGANKYFGTSVLIAERTYELLKGRIPCRRVGGLRVVGKTAAVSVYEPLSEGHVMRHPETLAKYEEALRLFEKGDLGAAKDLFSALAEVDPVSWRYKDRLDNTGEFAGEWNPEWNLLEK